HEHVELARLADDTEAVSLRDATRAGVPAKDRHPEARGRMPVGDVGEDGPDELPAATLTDEIGPHPVAHVDRPFLLLDAGYARLGPEAAEADEAAAFAFDREEAEILPQRTFGVVRGVPPGVVPAERPLGLVDGQLPRAHGAVNRAASASSRSCAARRARRGGS